MNKLVPMILFYLENGAQPRHLVTKKIKNYPKKMRDDAISYVLSNSLIKLEVKASAIGRSPVSISLTEKGAEMTLALSRKPRHESVWGGDK